MTELTERQRQVRDFIESQQAAGKPIPTLRDITRHFRFRSTRAAADHVQALVGKGALSRQPGKARSLRVLSPLQPFRRPVVDIPIYGSIPAGLAEDRRQEAQGCVSIDIETLGIKPTPRTFALEVSGDSMINAGIDDGDIVLVENKKEFSSDDIVLAEVEGESVRHQGGVRPEEVCDQA